MRGAQLTVVQKAWTLAETAKEGLDYALKQAETGDFAACSAMLSDVMEAFAGIQEALPVLEKAELSSLHEATEKLNDGFRRYLEAYEAHEEFRILHTLNGTLRPAFNVWQDELQAALRPYIVG